MFSAIYKYRILFLRRNGTPHLLFIKRFTYVVEAMLYLEGVLVTPLKKVIIYDDEYALPAVRSHFGITKSIPDEPPSYELHS